MKKTTKRRTRVAPRPAGYVLEAGETIGLDLMVRVDVMHHPGGGLVAVVRGTQVFTVLPRPGGAR